MSSLEIYAILWAIQVVVSMLAGDPVQVPDFPTFPFAK